MTWTCSNCHGPGTKAVWCTNCVRKDEDRIRELGAELDWTTRVLADKIAIAGREMARAEKAERERDEWRMKWAQEEALGAKDRARVAEVERKLERRLTIPPDMARKFEEVEAYNAREREEC